MEEIKLTRRGIQSALNIQRRAEEDAAHDNSRFNFECHGRAANDSRPMGIKSMSFLDCLIRAEKFNASHKAKWETENDWRKKGLIVDSIYVTFFYNETDREYGTDVVCEL